MLLFSLVGQKNLSKSRKETQFDKVLLQLLKVILKQEMLTRLLGKVCMAPLAYFRKS